MFKKVIMIITVIFVILVASFIYGVYIFLHPLGKLVDEEVSSSYFYNRDNDGVLYSYNGNWFSLGKHEMEVDMETFEIVGRDYAKDKENAYYRQEIIDVDVDISTFKTKSGIIPVDKNHVYTLSSYYDKNPPISKVFKIIEHADPATYEHLDYGFSKDKNFIFKDEVPCTEVDYDTFEIINTKFCKDVGNVYYFLNQKPLVKVEAINISEVVSISKFLIRDDEHVFFYVSERGGERIEELMRIPFVDSNTITFYENPLFLKIDNTIYYEGLALVDADASTFEEARYGYAKDANHVFYQGKIMEGADPASFNFDEKENTFSDKNHVYEGGKEAIEE